MRNKSPAPPAVTHDGKSEQLLSRRAASTFLREQGFPVAAATLASLVTRGGGPQYRKFGLRVLYNGPDLVEWANTKLSRPQGNSSSLDCHRTKKDGAAQ